jgi:hypothetical protein
MVICYNIGISEFVEGVQVCLQGVKVIAEVDNSPQNGHVF